MSDLVEKIVKRDDIKAKTPEPLNERVVYKIGITLSWYLKEKMEKLKKIIVGQDMRLSSPSLADALSQGLLSQGIAVERLGECSTEMISYVAGEKKVPAVMVTASHNPKEDNGFKIFWEGAVPIGKEALIEIVRKAEELPEPETIPITEQRKRICLGVWNGYVEKVLSVSNISREGYGRRIPVVIDAGNGMGGKVFQRIAEKIRWLKPIYFYEIPNGNIPSGIMPNTLDPRYLERLTKEVANERALLGICFDGDADRVAFVYKKETGEVSALTPSEVGALIIKKILESKDAGSKILYSLPCSAFIPELVEKLGGIGVMTPVGYGQVRQRITKTENSDCTFAMEHSGHYFYRDFYCADSAMITTLIVIDMVAHLAAQGENLSSIIFPWQTRFFQSDEINFEFSEPSLMQKRIDYFRKGLNVQPIEEYSAGDPIDTKTILKEERSLENYPGRYWFCLRPSGTEPQLRLTAEVILNKEMPEAQRIELGPKILTEKVNQLVNLVDKERG